MLQSLHNTASSFFIKLLLGLLVASFALWGIGDVFRSSSSSNVMQVGDSAISAQEFNEAMQSEMTEYRRMLGSQYSSDLLKTLGIPQQVLAKLVDRKLVELEAEEMGIAVPDSYTKAELRSNPAFKGENGHFDAEQFRVILRNNGLNESMYVSLLEKEAAADMLLQSALSGLRVTDTAARTAYLYANETRKADVLVFPPALVQNIADPNTVELEQYYEKNAESFRAAEHRIFSMVALDSNSLAEEMEVSEDDVLMEYQSRIDEFEEPEKREVKQLLFTDKASADKAAAALQAGESMETAGKEFGATNENLLLGNVTASGIIPEAEKTVFALEKNAYSAPVQSSFGWHIFQVTNIEPKRTRTLAEVKDELVSGIRNNRVGEEVYELSNTLQDDLAGGASIEEAARGVGASIRVFGPISMDATSPDGTAIVLPEGYERLLPTVFELGEGEVSNLMETDGGSYYAVRVDTVQPERTRALDEIRGQVIRDWKESQRGKNLYQLASGISSTLSSEDVANVATTTGATLLRNQEFRRDTSVLQGDRQIPAMMLTALFAAEKGAATEAFALQDGSYVVAKLTEVHGADAKSAEGRKQMERARENLRVLYGDEYYQQYMAYLRQKHGVSEPNQALIDNIIQ